MDPTANRRESNEGAKAPGTHLLTKEAPGAPSATRSPGFKGCRIYPFGRLSGQPSLFSFSLFSRCHAVWHPCKHRQLRMATGGPGRLPILDLAARWPVGLLGENTGGCSFKATAIGLTILDLEELLRHPFETATQPLRSQVRGSLSGKRQRKGKRQGWSQGEAVWVGVGEQKGHDNTFRRQMSCMQC